MAGSAVIVFAHTGIVKCGRSDPKFVKSVAHLEDERWCLNDAGHKSIHVAGKNLSWEREVERYNEEYPNE